MNGEEALLMPKRLICIFFPNLAQIILHSTLVENGETVGLGITKQIEMSEFLSLRVT